MEGTWIEPISKPSLKYISSSKFGKPPDKQNENLQNLGKPAVESFNFMLHEGLDKAVADITPLEFSLPSGRRVKLQFDSVELFSPSVPEGAGRVTDQRVYPKECRMRGSTYKGKLVARISWSVDGVKQMPIEKDMGSIPIMVKSDLCNLAKLSPAHLVAKGEHAEEWGGYFIIKGHERILRMLTGVRKNYPIAVQRETWKRRGKLFTDLGVLVRCVKEDMTSTNNVLHYLSNGTSKFMCSYKKALYYLPVVMVLKGLLDTTDEYIFEQLTLGMEDDLHYRERVALMLRQLQKEGLHSHQDVQRYIGRSFRLKIKDIPEWYTDEQVCEFLFRKSVAIHLGTNEEKFNLITFMARKLFAFVEDKCVVEGMDPVMMQEVLLGGHLYLQLLKDRLENWLSGLKYVILKKAKTSREEFTLSQGEMMWAFSKTSKLETTFETFLATGNLPSTADIGMMQDTGLSIVAENINRMRYMSHFKAVHRGAAFADTRNSDVRQLKPDAWGFLCPVHTPDGSPCGLLNHFTALCEVVNSPADWSGLPSVLVNLGMIPQGSSKHSVPFGDCYTVLLEGCVVGRVPVKEAARFVDKLRIRKVRGSQVPKTLEIVFVPKREPQGQYPGIFLFHAIARMMRPVLNLAANAVEYIGSFEQIYLNICITMVEAYKGITTHQELRETSFLSNLASLIPLPDFNQSPRNMYQCQMGKQTMGTPCHNWGLQTENKLYRIQTPTSPLLRPAHWDRLNMDEFAMGTNAIVAVISYTGYDMEDAMVINRASLQRGFAYGQVYKSEFVDLKEKRKGSLNQTFYFQRDPSVEELKAFIDADGLPYPGTILQEGDPYYCFFVREEGRYFVERYKGKETAFVDNIKLCGSEDGSQGLYKICITLRIPRFPSVGDKFASRAGQKGICSQQWLAEDLPFTESGLVPDIVFNPHGFPSRMTIAMMIESMAGKSAAVHGLVHDATPFQFSETNTAIDYFGKLLEASGYNYYGTEKLYSGVDGREMEADIFFGVVHYQRLRHMVSDKYQVRSTGPVDHITRQPIKGRKRGGGIRFGEMERDALASHGASFLLYDRLVECSDQSAAFLCKTCGSVLSPIGSGKSGSSARNAAPKPKCHVCGNGGKVTEIMIPHVLKYLIAELASVNIKCIIDAKSF